MNPINKARYYDMLNTANEMYREAVRFHLVYRMNPHRTLASTISREYRADAHMFVDVARMTRCKANAG